MSKRYTLTFETEAEAAAAVAENPESYVPGTLIFAETEQSLWVVDAAGSIAELAKAP